MLFIAGCDLSCGAPKSTLILRQGAKLALLGIVLGAAGAFTATRILASVLYEIKPSDPFTFCGVALFPGLITLLANYVPARRAAGIHPMTTLVAEVRRATAGGLLALAQLSASPLGIEAVPAAE